ncbi:hypothetical protein P7C71_g2772, partial [Lecanoromycetidae sp. Uapishka_2]
MSVPPPPPPPASSDLKIEKATSKDGAAYETGRPDVPEPSTDDDRVGSKTNFRVTVNWTVGDNAWIDTPLAIRNTTAIWRYKLYLSPSLFYKYRLEISITNDHYDYYFGDATGDSYEINTWTAGDHLVDFGSNNPTIVQIAGS